jgi:hypothetical protein
MISRLSRASFESRRKNPCFEPDLACFRTCASSFGAQTADLIAGLAPKAPTEAIFVHESNDALTPP